MTPTNTLIKNKVKRTYVLSSRNMELFEAEVAPGKRGVAVDEAIALWLEEQRRAKIRARIEEYFQDEESQALDAEIDRDWAPVSDELWAQLPEEDWPEPAVVFPRGYAAYLAENQISGKEIPPDAK